ncbi:DUF1810 domain-containing protein [Curtobacterium sp. RRHDQ10]|uniref:DUF1810 domain-containing protein n=1 Tax=Curtobacterium phyllosphaerae TaxID=3413379 RepID=UPI003BEFD855
MIDAERAGHDPADLDPFDLRRFVLAQDGVHDRAVAELRAGRKTSHWMWFVFPQIRGLGTSPMATRYAIGSLAEARAYLRHPVLGPRLGTAVDAARTAPAADVGALLGGIDAMKLRSSMTLFARAADDGAVDSAGDGARDGAGDGARAPFDAVLARWFAGEDPATLRLLDDALGSDR